LAALASPIFALAQSLAPATPPQARTEKVAEKTVERTAEKTYDIEAFDVQGVKLLRQIDVEKAVYPFLGPGRVAEDVERARAALEKVYRDRGYQSVAVEIPAQTLSDTIARLRVVEAPVGRLRVTGSRYFSPSAIRQEAAAFQEGKVPNITEAQRELAQLNRLADRRVTPLLRAGVVPGTVDVDLKVNDTLPLHGSVELGNDHNEFTKPLRATASIHYDNLWQLGQSATFTYSVAPENKNDSEVFAGSYLAPINNSSFSLLAFGYHSNSNVATLGGSTVLGKGYSIGGRAVDQLPRIGDVNQSLSFGLDFKDFEEKIEFGSTNTFAPVHYWPLNLTYNIQRDGPRFATKVSVSVTAGIPGLGSDTAGFENARLDARPEFVHLNVDITQSETLWRGFEAREHLVGQVADGALVSSEQLAAGGFTSIRGYLQSEAIGDEGLTGALEIVTPSLAPKWEGVFDDLRLYAFTDGGEVWVLQPAADQTRYFPLVSTGLGLRLSILRHLQSDIALGVPLLSGVATHADRPRATFSVKSDF
jgi:hemolysin activation/secretion protein